MQLAMIGLGRMGANMVRRLMRGGHSCIVFDRNPESVQELEGGVYFAPTVEAIVRITPNSNHCEYSSGVFIVVDFVV